MDAPTVGGSYNPADNSVFQFFNSAQQNPDSFLGFEIYYKFYDPANSTGYLSDETSLTSGLTGPSEIVSKLGYQPLYLWPPGYQVGDTISTRKPPLIPISDTTLKGTSFSVEIPFSVAGSGSGTPPATGFFPGVFVNGQTSPTVQVARYLPDPNHAGDFILKGFGSSDFNTSDGTNTGGDVPPSVIPTVTPATAFITLGLYAIAYGLATLTTPLYSVPVPLGTIQLTVIFTPPSAATP